MRGWGCGGLDARAGGDMNETDVLQQLGPAGIKQHWVYWCGCGVCTPILGSALRCAGWGSEKSLVL